MMRQKDCFDHNVSRNEHERMLSYSKLWVRRAIKRDSVIVSDMIIVDTSMHAESIRKIWAKSVRSERITTTQVLQDKVKVVKNI